MTNMSQCVSIRQQWKPHVEGPTMLCVDQCTSLAQPLDALVNAPFKCVVDDLATNQGNYVHGNFSAKQRGILLTAWIGEAWEKTHVSRENLGNVGFL